MARALKAKLPHFRLYLLGTFRLECNGQPIYLATRKIESLLAYLILYPQVHSREKLATLFWGNSTDEQARASLRNALAILRKSLGEEIIFTDREMVQFNFQPSFGVDALEFQTIAESGAKMYALESESKAWQSAIDLYQGDLLAEFYDEWIIPKREQFRASYLNLLLKLAQWWRGRSDYSRAIKYARRVLMIDPANELAHQNIIFCLIASGDRAGALKQYDECERVLRHELDVEPLSETRTLCQWIRETEPSRSSREALLTNLPNLWPDFVGCQAESAELEHLVQQHRLVTLTGAGGCGKTRLAIHVASNLIHAFHDGAWWVNLASLNDEELVFQTVAHALGVRESSNQTLLDMLVNYLRAKHLVLLLDGCEHLVDTCALLIETLLSRCAQLHVLATGREALGVAGEVIYQVFPLKTPNPEQWRARLPIISPETLAEIAQFDAVQLFVNRARLVNSHFVLSGKNVFAVAEICYRLDGIPLAIELAAARTRTMTVSQIADRLGDRFRLLTDGCRTALPHHQTMKAAIDWSYEPMVLV